MNNLNNFDTSSSGVNLELTCYFDTIRSQEDFTENFFKDDYIKDYWHFVDYGNFDPIDLRDTKNYSFKKSDLISLLHGVCYLDEAQILSRDMFNKSYEYLNKGQLMELIEDLFYYDTDIITVFIKYLNPKFERLTVTGYSQGDRATVVFSHKAIEEYSNKDQDNFLSNMENYFSNIFYDAPLYCRLVIDNDQEIYLDETLNSLYEYDKDQIIAYAKKEIKHNKKDYITNWLETNLPDQPDYL